jgi:hypothetical protein
LLDEIDNREMCRTEKGLIQAKSKGFVVDGGFGGMRRRSEDNWINPRQA